MLCSAYIVTCAVIVVWQLSLISTAVSLLEDGWEEILQAANTTAALLIAMAGSRFADRFEYRRFRCEQYRDLKRSMAADIRSEETITRDGTEIYGERQHEERAVELMSDLRAGDRVAIYQIRLNLLRDQSYWFGRDL